MTFKNSSTDDHTFTANGGGFDSGVIAPGQSYAFTFATRGSSPYYCKLHPYMTATISVT